mgnify:CR=1 FL=1
MEIIKSGEGYGQHDLYALFSCQSCGARVAARKSEGQYVSDWKDGDYVTLNCPQCGHDNVVSVEIFVLTHSDVLRMKGKRK